jgi:hypothetical protein
MQTCDDAGRRTLRRSVCHAKRNLVAYLALFVALGGTSYAAAKLPANTIGTKQLKNNAVTSAKVKNNSLRGRRTSRAASCQRGARAQRDLPGWPVRRANVA